MSRPTPRRPASSRGTTPRPRRLAGQGTPALPDAPEANDAPETNDGGAESAAPAAGRSSEKTRRPVVLDKSSDQSTTDEVATPAPGQPSVKVTRGGPERDGVLARPKTTRILLVVLSLVALVLATLCVLFVVDASSDDDPVQVVDATGQLTVPDGLPVVAAQDAVIEGVDAAAKAAQEIVAVDFSKYDDEVAAASDLLTSSFEEQYRSTAADIKAEFVANQTVVQANVVAQGVVRSNLTRLQALVFLNQVVSRVKDGKPETVVTPYKVLVTMVHTDQGWLVDGLDTDAPQDKSN